MITRSIAALALVLAVLAAPSPAAADARSVLIEAEQFDDYGGWVDDSQFMDQMGSPFLLAHGLGTPVKDATTTVRLPAAGTYRVWVRTRDWVAPWKAPGAPGRFQVLVDGKRLETTFGTEGAAWHWQDGGQIVIDKQEVVVSLHDLTGFEGRCDAILLAAVPPAARDADADFIPPNKDPEMTAWRHKLLKLPEKTEQAGPFDLVVVGGAVPRSTEFAPTFHTNFLPVCALEVCALHRVPSGGRVGPHLIRNQRNET